MKKILLTLALVVAASAAYGQGTLFAQNGTTTRAQRETGANTGVYENVPATAGLFRYGIWIGDTADTMTLRTVVANSGTSIGIIPLGNTYIVTGTPQKDGNGNINNVWVQVRGWTASFGDDWLTASTTAGAHYGTTLTKQFALGPDNTGPGTVIWTSFGAADPAKLLPLRMNVVVPEPSTAAVAALGIASLLIFRRRK
jgi:hypothetical protein